MPSKQRLRRERPEGTEEMIVGTFDPETGEEIEQRKISLAGSQSVKEEVSRTLDALFEQEFMPEGLVGRRFYQPADNPKERELAQRITTLWKGKY